MRPCSRGTRLAFVSTRDGYRANIWVLDLERGQNLTGAEDLQGDPAALTVFRPSWSPPIGVATMTATAENSISSRRNAIRDCPPPRVCRAAGGNRY
jgi:hypothetical protein